MLLGLTRGGGEATTPAPGGHSWGCPRQPAGPLPERYASSPPQGARSCRPNRAWGPLSTGHSIPLPTHPLHEWQPAQSWGSGCQEGLGGGATPGFQHHPFPLTAGREAETQAPPRPLEVRERKGCSKPPLWPALGAGRAPCSGGHAFSPTPVQCFRSPLNEAEQVTKTFKKI